MDEHDISLAMEARLQERIENEINEAYEESYEEDAEWDERDREQALWELANSEH